MKLTSWGGKFCSGHKRTVRLTFGLSTSNTDSYRHRLFFLAEIGFWRRDFAIHFGQRKFPARTFAAGEVAICCSDTETVMLREGQKYTVTRSFYEPSRHNDDSMTEVLELKELTRDGKKFSYEAWRFIHEGGKLPPYDPYYGNPEDTE